MELSKKLKELRKLQGLLLSLGNRVEQATAIQDTKGKVVSEEDAAVLREEFANLQKLMGMLQSEVDNVENGESKAFKHTTANAGRLRAATNYPFPI